MTNPDPATKGTGMDLTTAAVVRDFLALCLDPGRGIMRTPAELAKIMPGPLRDALERHAPHLAELREASDALDMHARAAHQVYAYSLDAWIRNEPCPVPEKAPVTPDEERREKYAEALYATQERTAWANPWVTLSPLRRAVWYARADAAIRLADAEHAAAQPVAVDPATYLCPQLRFGDKAVQGDHDYRASAFVEGVPHCLFCGQLDPSYQGDGAASVPPRDYVFNARSVNRTTKHIPDGQGHSLCRWDFEVTAPIPPEEAAALALCGSCWRAIAKD